MDEHRDIPFVENTDIKEWRRDCKAGQTPSNELTSMEIEHRPLLVGDWLRIGDLGFIFAARGLGKTWFAMNMAKGIAVKQNVGPWKTHLKTKVLYLDGEMSPSDLQARDMAIGPPTKDLIYLNHEILFQRTGRTMNLADPGFQQATLDCCLEDEIQVLIADNLSTLSFGIDENKSLDWEIILPWLLRLRRFHITVIFVHHAGRNNEMRGTSKREDPAFWIVRLDQQTNDERAGANFISRFTKWRNASERPRSYEWSFTPVGDHNISIEFKECTSMELFLQWIESGLDTCTDIAAEMDLSKGAVSRLAKRAISLGKITLKGRHYFIADSYQSNGDDETN